MPDPLVTKLHEYPPELQGFLIRKIDPTDVAMVNVLERCGVTRDHAPALQQMIADEALRKLDEGYFWQGPFLASLALCTLDSVESIPALLGAIDRFGEDYEFWYEVFPDTLESFGPRLLPPLADHILTNPSAQITSLQVGFTMLEQIGLKWPEHRAECVDILTRFLQTRHESLKDEDVVNGSAVSALIDLDAIESAAVIEAAYAADRVDEMMCGNWPSVKEELALGPEGREAKWKQAIEHTFPNHTSQPRRPDPAKLVRKQARAARKQSRKSRKKSR